MTTVRNPTLNDTNSKPGEPARRQPARVQSRPAADQVWRELVKSARARYRDSGLFAWFFARGKLEWDPVFRSLLERGDIPPFSQVLDIGCGQGLLASLLAATDDAHARSSWPDEWPMAPVGCGYTGVELMPRDALRAQRALEGLPSAATVLCADMAEADFPACDVVVILDVLHYVSHAVQQAILARTLDSLRRQGRLLLRVGDMTERRGFAASQWTDRIITAGRGHRVAPTFCRPLVDWVSLLEQIGFAKVSSIPMSRGTPFANVLLVAEKE